MHVQALVSIHFHSGSSLFSTKPSKIYQASPKSKVHLFNASSTKTRQPSATKTELGFTHFHASLHLPVLPLCLCEGKRVFDCCNTRRWICNPFAVPAKSQQLRTLILQSHNPRLCKTWKMVKHLQLPETFHITS